MLILKFDDLFGIKSDQKLDVNRKLILKMISKGIDTQIIFHNSILNYACVTKDDIFAKELINMGCDINVCDVDGCSPLIWSVYKSMNDITKLLLEKDADLDAVDKTHGGLTALMYACKNKNSEIAKHIIDKYNSKSQYHYLNAKNHYGETFEYYVNENVLVDVINQISDTHNMINKKVNKQFFVDEKKRKK